MLKTGHFRFIRAKLFERIIMLTSGHLSFVRAKLFERIIMLKSGHLRFIRAVSQLLLETEAHLTSWYFWTV